MAATTATTTKPDYFLKYLDERFLPDVWRYAIALIFFALIVTLVWTRIIQTAKTREFVVNGSIQDLFLGSSGNSLVLLLWLLWRPYCDCGCLVDILFITTHTGKINVVNSY